MAAAPPCPAGSICSGQFGTKVDNKNLYFSTATAVTQGSDNKVNGGKNTLYYYDGSNWKTAATSTNGKDWVFEKDSSGKDVLGASAQKSLASGDLGKNAAAKTGDALEKAGVQPEQAKTVTPPGKSKNDGKPGTEESKPSEGEAAAAAASKDTSKTRTKYDSIVIYPKSLKSDQQDCIKFSMLQYTPSELKSQGSSESKSRVVSVSSGVPKIASRDVLSTIVLPIPGGISDSNTVEWSADSISEFQQAFADIGSTAIQSGPDAAADVAKDRTSSALSKDGGKAAENTLTAKFTEAATKSANIQQRKYGTIANPNLELLFTGPSLRTFNFTFRMSPRNKDDAEQVLKIIRYFKQGMSVKRDASSLILRSPHTFAIAYVCKNNQHKFLNKFKECALTACNVSYAPDGNYMTYYGNSMTAYELSLTFQELEPLFDDEYGNSDDGVGF